jgi:hypothetical protein
LFFLNGFFGFFEATLHDYAISKVAALSLSGVSAAAVATTAPNNTVNPQLIVIFTT